MDKPNITDWLQFLVATLMLIIVVYFSYTANVTSDNALKIAQEANNISKDSLAISNQSYEIAKLTTDYIKAEKKPNIELLSDDVNCKNFESSTNVRFTLINHGQLPVECQFEVIGENIYCRTEDNILKDNENNCIIEKSLFYENPRDFHFYIYGKKEYDQEKGISLSFKYTCVEPTFNSEVPNKTFAWDYDNIQVDNAPITGPKIYYTCS